jgi:hypothetical protein
VGPELEVFVTNRDLTVNRRVFQYSGLEVVSALNDARTCKFTGPIHDINALGQSNIQHFLPLRRFLKVFYRGHLVFWGPITKPIFNLAQNSVEVNAHDPSIWWKNHHLSEDDVAIHKPGVKINGEGLWDLVQAAAPLQPGEFGYADPGIVLGSAEDYLLDGEDERRMHLAKRGESVFSVVQAMSEVADGPDWELVPIDSNYDPFDAYVPGAMAALRAREEISRERQEVVIFHFGFGRMNLSNFIYEPDGNTVRNRFVVEGPRGKLAVAGWNEGLERDGIMEGWETAQGKDLDQSDREFFAHEQVRAYGNPLPTFTIEPVWDQGLMGSSLATPWRWPSGYRVGDRIRAVAKLGEFEEDLEGRVTKVTLSQLNQAENVRAQVECIPEPVLVDDLWLDESVT